MKTARMVALAALMWAPAVYAQALSVDALLAEVKRNWYEPDTPGLEERLREGAARGLLHALNQVQAEKLNGVRVAVPEDEDGVNRIYTPDEFKLFRQEVAGKFGGVGLMLGPPHALEHEHDQEPGRGMPMGDPPGPFVVLKLVPGMPGEKAGMKPGDVVKSVDGVDATTMPLKDLVLKLRGDAGSAVTIGVERAGRKDEFKLVRAEIKLPAVELTERPDGTGLLAFHEFNEGALDELRAALAKANASKLHGLVIDLRNNPGGALDVAYAACKLFLAKGEVMARTRRHGEGEKTHTNDQEPIWKGPLVVLVNRNTRSSAELFAGALQDNKKALVVGERTFGKGTAETLMQLPGGYAVKITSLVLYRPSGAATAKGGLEPDVPIAVSHAKDDHGTEPVEAAFRILAFAHPKGP